MVHETDEDSERFWDPRSRIIELTLKKNAMVTGCYAYGWTKQIPKEDEESALCLGYLLNKYGRSPIKKRKEMGFQE